MSKQPPGEKFYVAVVSGLVGHMEGFPSLCSVSLSQADGYTEEEMDALVVDGQVRSEYVDRPGNPFNVFCMSDVRQLTFHLYAVVETDGTVVSAAVTSGRYLMTRAQLRDVRAGGWLDDDGKEAVTRVWEAIRILWEDPFCCVNDELPKSFVIPADALLTEE